MTEFLLSGWEAVLVELTLDKASCSVSFTKHACLSQLIRDRIIRGELLANNHSPSFAEICAAWHRAFAGRRKYSAL